MIGYRVELGAVDLAERQDQEAAAARQHALAHRPAVHQAGREAAIIAQRVADMEAQRVLHVEIDDEDPKARRPERASTPATLTLREVLPTPPLGEQKQTTDINPPVGRRAR